MASSASQAPSSRGGTTCRRTTCTGRERLPPFWRWKWSKKPVEARALHAFADLYDDKSAGKRARVARDDDTGLFRLEVLDGDRWWPVRTLAGAPPKVTGTLHLQGRYLIRVHRSENIDDWDEARGLAPPPL